MLRLEGKAIITGGGPSIMEAGNRGCFLAEQQLGWRSMGYSIGCPIKLPNEQSGNKFLTEILDFNYFFPRKVGLSYFSRAILIEAGGFGTIDEFAEFLSLAIRDPDKRQLFIFADPKFGEPVVEAVKGVLSHAHTRNEVDQIFRRVVIAADRHDAFEKICLFCDKHSSERSYFRRFETLAEDAFDDLVETSERLSGFLDFRKRILREVNLREGSAGKLADKFVTFSGHSAQDGSLDEARRLGRMLGGRLVPTLAVGDSDLSTAFFEGAREAGGIPARLRMADESYTANGVDEITYRLPCVGEALATKNSARGVFGAPRLDDFARAMEELVLMQTHKAPVAPRVFMGEHIWKPFRDFAYKTLYQTFGTISGRDVDLMWIAGDHKKAIRQVMQRKVA
ncbi:MAG: LOG family protein [Deltaproteobacteria bacterium]|nr:LOG family protein [Deltaproteobacteria bacterium]